MDGGAWWATVHGVAKSQTRLSDFTFTLSFNNELCGRLNKHVPKDVHVLILRRIFVCYLIWQKGLCV